MIFPIEGNRWIVTLSGIADRVPPTDEAGFREFARTLADPAIYEAIKDAEPLSPIMGYRRTENKLRHYEQLIRRTQLAQRTLIELAPALPTPAEDTPPWWR